MNMTNRLVVSFVAVALAAAAVHAGQTTRIGMPARGGATSADVLVLQQINLATGQPYGTMPVQYVIEALPRLTGIADLAIVGWAGGSPGLSMDATSRPILATAEATFNTLSVLGIRPAIGRDFTEADVLAGRRFAILTAGAWERHFGKRIDAIGSTAWMRPANGTPEPVEIIGVLAPGVLTSTPELDSLTDALVLTPRRFLVSAPDERCPAGILRLRPGVSLATAQRSINEAVEAARTQLTESSRGFGARLFTLRGK